MEIVLLCNNTHLELKYRSIPVMNKMEIKYKKEVHFKRLVHPKMKIMSLMTHPHVVPSL